ncbi:MAG: branched-chain amino acid ABC transporter permease [Alphaproteobacteria bacterium]
MDGSQILQLALSGLVTGSIYALVALGFTVIFKSTDAINFAQGEWVMAGGMIGAFLHASFALPPLLLVPIVTVVVAFIGLCSERLTIYPLRTPNPILLTLITIAVAITTRAGVTLVLGKAPAGLPSFSGNESIHFAGATLQPQALWVIGITLVVMFGTNIFFQRSLLGRAMRAAAADREAAGLVGIYVNRMVMWSFVLAAAIGAIAGLIITPLTLTSVNVGLMLGFKGFSAAMLGGLGNLHGALLGGLVLGLLESLSAGLISSQFKDVVAFVVLLIVLFLKPAGLLGRASAERA